MTTKTVSEPKALKVRRSALALGALAAAFYLGFIAWSVLSGWS